MKGEIENLAKYKVASIQLMKIVNLLQKNGFCNENGAFIIRNFQNGNIIPVKNLMAILPEDYEIVKKELEKILNQIE